jgi:hypothetical protein
VQLRCFYGGGSFLPVALCEVSARRIRGLEQTQEFDARLAHCLRIHSSTVKDGAFELDDPYRKRAQPANGSPAVSRVAATVARLHEHRE